MQIEIEIDKPLFIYLCWIFETSIGFHISSKTTGIDDIITCGGVQGATVRYIVSIFSSIFLSMMNTKSILVVMQMCLTVMCTRLPVKSISMSVEWHVEAHKHN